LLLPGCGRSVEQPLEQEVEKSYAANRDATLSIKNMDGSIRIYGSEAAEIKVQATKAAYTAERLNEIGVNILARPESVSIETRFPPKNTWGLFDRSGTVDYVIVVPKTATISQLDLANGEVLIDAMEGEGVRARLDNGRLFAHNCFGNLHLTVINGGLDIIYEWWEPRRFSVEAQIVKGNLRAFLPGDASFHLAAEAVNGKIGNDFAEKEQRNKSTLHKNEIKVGEQLGADIKLRAEDGNIKVVGENP
jgi:hypothetical protein